LVNKQFAIENGPHRNSGFTQLENGGSFQFAMLKNQRVDIFCWLSFSIYFHFRILCPTEFAKNSVSATSVSRSGSIASIPIFFEHVGWWLSIFIPSFWVVTNNHEWRFQTGY